MTVGAGPGGLTYFTDRFNVLLGEVVAHALNRGRCLDGHGGDEREHFGLSGLVPDAHGRSVGEFEAGGPATHLPPPQRSVEVQLMCTRTRGQLIE